MGINSYKELIVWQKSMNFVAEIYTITEKYPKSELYGLTSQIRRSAVSIPSNIAEGWTRKHLPEYLQLLNIALGSAAELETQLIIATRLNFISQRTEAELQHSITEIMKMLNGIINKLKA